jgi:hypothetical protein
MENERERRNKIKSLFSFFSGKHFLHILQKKTLLVICSSKNLRLALSNLLNLP